MPLTMQEEIALRAAFMEIQRERKASLRVMFAGTQLKPKSRLEDAMTLAKEAKTLKKELAAVPGVGIPDLSLPIPSLNVNLFKGIDLRRLVDFRLPTLTLPGIDFSWIPDIRLGDLPGFSLPRVRLNLKGILTFKDLLPNISLRALAYALAIKWPDIRFPALMFELCRILEIDFDALLPQLRIHFPDFFELNLVINLPHLSLPDIDFPGLPSLDLPSIDLSGLHIPGIDLPALLRLPGFDRVLRLLMELFDLVDLGEIIGELGLEFFTDFCSSALPFVQQVKSGAQAASSWGRAASDWHKARKTTVQRTFLLPGNARDACDAVAVLLRDSRDQNAALATIQTTQFAVSTAGLFADLGGATGPAVAATAAFAKTCQKVMLMGVRYKEMKKINQVLRDTPEEHLSSNIFKISPLLGCYYLANNTASNVLNVLSHTLAEDGWMTEWAHNKRTHLDPLIREAQRFILESRYVLTPLRQNLGMYVELGFFGKLQAAAELYVKKKRGLVPSHTSAPSRRYIG